MFLDSASVLFDSRLRLVLFGPDSSSHIKKFSERHFGDDDGLPLKKKFKDDKQPAIIKMKTQHLEEETIHDKVQVENNHHLRKMKSKRKK